MRELQIEGRIPVMQDSEADVVQVAFRGLRVWAINRRPVGAQCFDPLAVECTDLNLVLSLPKLNALAYGKQRDHSDHLHPLCRLPERGRRKGNVVVDTVMSKEVLHAEN
jgi:hypothetical protein